MGSIDLGGRQYFLIYGLLGGKGGMPPARRNGGKREEGEKRPLLGLVFWVAEAAEALGNGAWNEVGSSSSLPPTHS